MVSQLCVTIEPFKKRIRSVLKRIRKMLKYKIAFFLIVVVSVFCGPMHVQAIETIDRIVAVVNDEPITQSELDSLLVPIYEQYRSAYTGQEFVEKMNEARQNLLNQLIEDRLIAQEAKRVGVPVTEEEIDFQLSEVKKKFPSENEFRMFLEQQNVNLDSLRDRYRDQIAVRKLHQYEVRQKVIVSPKEIEEYYLKHLDEYTEKEKLKVRTIMIRMKVDEDGNDIARPLIDRIVSDLKEGASFAELAKEYSEETHAAQGGELGFIKRGELIEEFDSVLFSLPVGELSPVLETQVGYHIFQVEAKQEKKTKSLGEVKDEISNVIFRRKSKERYEKWIEELKENAYISIK